MGSGVAEGEGSGVGVAHAAGYTWHVGEMQASVAASITSKHLAENFGICTALSFHDV